MTKQSHSHFRTLRNLPTLPVTASEKEPPLDGFAPILGFNLCYAVAFKVMSRYDPHA